MAPNWRLTQDSSRSPNCATTDSSNATIAIAVQLNAPKKLATRTATIMAPSVPATAPDQVFFGLTAGISFGPPKARPAK